MKLFSLILLSLSFTTSFELARADAPMSAVRFRGESYEEAVARVYQGRKASRHSAQEAAFDYEFEKVRDLLPEWDGSETTLQEAFEYSRDLRFLPDANRPGMIRRSTWLYPDDGCNARAALVVENLANRDIEKPQKIFAFGRLKASSPNAIEGRTPERLGTVTWWYHVAPIVRIGEKVFVFDAALEPRHPLELERWISSMHAEPARVDVAICDPHTYVPDSSCRGTISDGGAESAQKSYFNSEWKRLVELGRDPEAELGEHPPWLND